MLEASLQRIIETVPDDAVVLDIGGWAKPLPRADWVLDLMPYETRGLYGSLSPDQERFTPDTWIERDICDPEPYPFADNAIDFVVCSHTLEDIRDPIQVCREMARIAKAGYIEVPSRHEEQAWGVNGKFAGWSHHRWLVDPIPGGLEFVFKFGVVHGPQANHFPAGYSEALSSEQRVLQVWWTGSFEFRERIFMVPAELDAYLAEFVERGLRENGPAPGGRSRRLRRRST
jgi:hypothetical protein